MWQQCCKSGELSGTGGWAAYSDFIRKATPPGLHSRNGSVVGGGDKETLFKVSFLVLCSNEDEEIGRLEEPILKFDVNLFRPRQV